MKTAADKIMKECLIVPDGKKELVPVMEIYGANAAGKSNVLYNVLYYDGIKYALRMVIPLIKSR
jgi:hypothetical protein